MAVERIKITGVRNLRSAEITDTGRVNLIYGENGSGKTSILESLYILGVTRSFRSRKMDTVINRDVESCVVWGELRDHRGKARKIGIERSRHKSPAVKVDGGAVHSLGDIAGILPLQVINAEGFRLLEGPPVFRRELLDWGVFHVEHHRFFSVWRRYRRALQQRNALLRHGKIDPAEIRVWNGELVAAGDQLHAYRVDQCKALSATIQSVFESLGRHVADPVPPLSFQYYAGWDDTRTLDEELEEGLPRDARLGYTRSGPHRADIRIKTGAMPASDILSRGQIKTLVCAIRIAQAKMLQQYGINSVFLIDDLPAELDEARRKAICRHLLELNGQVFVTAIEPHELDDCWHDADIKRFHVEHGCITPS